jgi:hypothetical protein
MDKMTSNDSHNRNERKGERSRSITSAANQPVASRQEVGAKTYCHHPEVWEVGGARAPGPHQEGQVPPCVIDQQQSPQANLAAVTATEAAAQPQASPTSQPSESMPMSPLTSALAAPPRAPDLPPPPLEPVSGATAGAAPGAAPEGGLGEGRLGRAAAAAAASAAAEAWLGSTTSGRLGSAAAEKGQTIAPTSPAAPLEHLQRQTASASASAWSAAGATAAAYRDGVAWEAGKPLQGGAAATPTSPSHPLEPPPSPPPPALPATTHIPSNPPPHTSPRAGTAAAHAACCAPRVQRSTGRFAPAGSLQAEDRQR